MRNYNYKGELPMKLINMSQYYNIRFSTFAVTYVMRHLNVRKLKS